MEYFRKTGSMGGNARARKHSKKQLSEWGKMGGRPKGSGRRQREASDGGLQTAEEQILVVQVHLEW